MNATDIDGVLEFLRATEALKIVTHSAYTSAGERESVAEHTWRLCLMALLLAPSVPDVDVARLLHDEILGLWDEHEAAATPEAQLAKGLDKLETILQHTQGKNPPDFDYAFNLAYGRKHTAQPEIVAVLRAVLDRETQRRADETDEARR